MLLKKTKRCKITLYIYNKLISERSDKVDIITEILETDGLAQEKINEAGVNRLEIMKNAEDKSEKLKSDARAEVEKYRAEKEAEIHKNLSADILKIKTAEQVKIHEFDKLYEDNHEAWEKEILESILAQ